MNKDWVLDHTFTPWKCAQLPKYATSALPLCTYSLEPTGTQFVNHAIFWPHKTQGVDEKVVRQFEREWCSLRFLHAGHTLTLKIQFEQSIGYGLVVSEPLPNN